ncbi:MAG TPA: 50S ribosomal protein L29 [Dehalococcoidia bacterium]|nr:50S ribosomal protein L29 [Dehalococcoidia bacterium]
MKKRDQLRDLRSKSDAELQTELDETYRELFNLRFRLATRNLGNDRVVPETRKKIARIKTLLHQRALTREA